MSPKSKKSWAFYLLALEFGFWGPFLLQGLTWAMLYLWTQNYSQIIGTCPGHHAPPPLKHQSNAVENLESMPTAFEEYKKDFLSAEAANDLRAFLEQESYCNEGSREVAFYGQKYQYMGSKKNPKPIPTVLKPLLDSLNTNLDYELNQV